MGSRIDMNKLVICFAFLPILRTSCFYKPKPINPYSPSPLRWKIGLHSFFARELIIPYCIENIPNKTCDIIYQRNIKIETGMDYDQFEAVSEPHVTWEADKDSLYLLYMLGFAEFYAYKDVDNVVRNTLEDEWIQWLVHDIPGNQLVKGKVAYPYNELRIPDPYLKNVYAIVIYKQPGKLNIDLPPLTKKGSHEFTSHKEFAKKYNLGDPICGNLFVFRFIPQESGEPITLKTIDPNIFDGGPLPLPTYAVSFNPDYPDDPYHARKTTTLKP